MKIEKWITLLLVLCMIFLEGCKGIQVDTSNKILAPKNYEAPIKGTWNIEKYKTIGKSTLATEDVNKLINKTAEFDVNCASFDDEMCNNAEYKIKNIDAKYYFSHTYNIDLSVLGINIKDIEVISVTSGEKLFYDFIRINEKQLLAYMDNTFFYLTKISESTDIAKKMKENEGGQESAKEQKGTGADSRQSGILLGLRGDANEGQGGLSYRTLWISSINCKIGPVKETENLLVPRKTGFWRLGVKRSTNEGYTNDVIFSYPMEGNKNLSEPKSQINIPSNFFRKILFVGNDFVSTEYSFINGIGKKGSVNRLQVLPMDKIYDSKGIKISDVAGENGKSALIAAGNAFLSSHEDKELYEGTPREDSFGILRKNGHWAVTGRINSKEAVSDAFLDFNVNIMPPSKMLNYDNLHVSWKEIKQKVPDAIDVYTSPNKDIALIICKNVICVYAIQGKKLSDRAIKRINMKDGENVVMAEWATGDYVERWGKIFGTIGTIVNEK